MIQAVRLTAYCSSNHTVMAPTELMAVCCGAEGKFLFVLFPEGLWPPQVWQLSKNELVNSATPHKPFMEPAVVMDTNPFSQAKPGGCWGQAVRGPRHPLDPIPGKWSQGSQGGKHLTNAKTLSQGALCSQHGRGCYSWKPWVKAPFIDNCKGMGAPKSMPRASKRGGIA